MDKVFRCDVLDVHLPFLLLSLAVSARPRQQSACRYPTFLKFARTVRPVVVRAKSLLLQPVRLVSAVGPEQRAKTWVRTSAITDQVFIILFF